MAELITPTQVESINQSTASINTSGGSFVTQDQSVITITPFDNYYAFTLFSDDKIALDLSDSSSYFLAFVDNSNEIRIKNKVGVEGINPSNGDLLFKIDSISSRKILGLTTRMFFITSKIVSDDVSSEETVLFKGNWIRYDEEFDDVQLKRIAELNTIISQLNQQISTITVENQTLVNSLRSQIATLQSENLTLRNRIERLLRILNKYDIVDASDSSDILDSANEIVRPKPVFEEDKVRLAIIQDDLGNLLPFNPNIPGNGGPTRPGRPNPGRPGSGGSLPSQP